MAEAVIPDRAISVRAPWWAAILHLGKDIENRPRHWHHQGRVWLHASSWWSTKAVQDEWWNVARHCYMASEAFDDQPRTGPTWSEMKAAGGSIVGSVELCGSVEESDSPWFFGPVGIKLANPVALSTPVPCKGALGLFRLPSDVLEELAGRIAGGIDNG